MRGTSVFADAAAAAPQRRRPDARVGGVAVKSARRAARRRRGGAGDTSGRAKAGSGGLGAFLLPRERAFRGGVRSLPAEGARYLRRAARRLRLAVRQEPAPLSTPRAATRRPPSRDRPRAPGLRAPPPSRSTSGRRARARARARGWPPTRTAIHAFARLTRAGSPRVHAGRVSIMNEATAASRAERLRASARGRSPARARPAASSTEAEAVGGTRRWSGLGSPPATSEGSDAERRARWRPCAAPARGTSSRDIFAPRRVARRARRAVAAKRRGGGGLRHRRRRCAARTARPRSVRRCASAALRTAPARAQCVRSVFGARGRGHRRRQSARPHDVGGLARRRRRRGPRRAARARREPAARRAASSSRARRRALQGIGRRFEVHPRTRRRRSRRGGAGRRLRGEPKVLEWTHEASSSEDVGERGFDF